MAIMVFDTETTSLEKPFCYNVGYVILDPDTRETLVKRDYVVEQIWHNLPLFATAYYAEKRPEYVRSMRSKKTILEKWGWIMKQMRKDIKDYCVVAAYAYNSPFDDKVFTFNNDWFKTINPFENLPIYDIRGYANEYITNRSAYKQYCEDYKFFTDAGNYPATAEVVYRFITEDAEFIEAHTALNDSEIEAEILLHCIDAGARFETDYSVQRTLARKVPKPCTIKVDNEILFQGEYVSKFVREGTYSFKTK